MTQLTRTPPPQMIADIAYGMESPVDIAWRYGYSASEYKALEENPTFVAQVASARSDLEKGGHTVKVKARWMVEQLMDDAYIRAKNAGSSLPQVLDTVKTLARLGDLEPKNTVAPQGAGGPAFSVVINIPSLPKDDASKIIGGDELITFPAFEEKPNDE